MMNRIFEITGYVSTAKLDGNGSTFNITIASGRWGWGLQITAIDKNGNKKAFDTLKGSSYEVPMVRFALLLRAYARKRLTSHKHIDYENEGGEY